MTTGTALLPAGSAQKSVVAVAGMAAVLLAPFVVALAHLRAPAWFPVFDLAMTELRVRDVFSSHPPLIGLPGRISDGATLGSHPGPISFFIMAPAYRLLGGSSWALQAATATLHGLAVVVALAIGARRGGARGVAAVGVLLAVLIQGYGLPLLTEPWNPHLPVLWFAAFLLAAWSVAIGDFAMVPVAAVAGSVCAQTHVPYVAMAGGLGAFAVVAAALAWRALPAHSPARRRGLRWCLLGTAAGLLLWTPPLVDQATRDPGNFRILADHFASPPEVTIGPGRGIDELLPHLDGWYVLVDQTIHPGSFDGVYQPTSPSRTRGTVSLALWGAAAVAALRSKNAPLIRLHALIAAALVVAFAAISRIFGVPWYYLMLWCWTIGALMVLSMLWTFADTIARALPTPARPRVAALAPAIGIVVVSLCALRLGAAAGSTTQGTPDITAQLARLVPRTAAALEQRANAGNGSDAVYLVSWTDAVYGGSQGYGLLNELERRGFHVGVEPGDGRTTGVHRVLHGEASTRVHLATGAWIERWRAVPGAEAVAEVDPRTAEQRAEFEALRTEVVTALEDEGLYELAEGVDLNLFGTGMHPRLPKEMAARIGRMLTIGTPAAVFVAPVAASP